MLLLYHRRPPHGEQGLGGARHLWVALAALVAIVLPHSIAAAPTKEVRRILILNEVGPSYPIIGVIDQGIRSGLDNSPYKLEFYYEYLETVLFPNPTDQKQFREFYVRKYQNRRPDVIITVGPAPLRFMLEAHKRFFPEVPVIFCLPNGLVAGSPTLDPDFTGVETDFAARNNTSSSSVAAWNRARRCGWRRNGL